MPLGMRGTAASPRPCSAQLTPASSAPTPSRGSPLPALLADAARQVLGNHGPLLGAVDGHQPASRKAMDILGWSSLQAGCLLCRHSRRQLPGPKPQRCCSWRCTAAAAVALCPRAAAHAPAIWPCTAALAEAAPNDGLILLWRPGALVHIRVEHLHSKVARGGQREEPWSSAQPPLRCPHEMATHAHHCSLH